MIDTPLFETQLIRLERIDPQRDAAIISAWSHNPDYLWSLDDAPAYPLSVPAIKKQIDAQDKEAEKGRREWSFIIRAREGERPMGLIRLTDLHWSTGTAQLSFGFAEPDTACAREAIRLMLRYAFAELNLHRLEVKLDESSAWHMQLLQQAGFREEVRRRQAIFRKGRRWDLLHLGILREEWRDER